MVNLNNGTCVWINLDNAWNIIKIVYDCSTDTIHKIDGILNLTKEELWKVNNQNIDYIETFNELSLKYKSQIEKIIEKNEPIIIEEKNETEKFMTNFFDKIRKILSKNSFTRSLSTSES